MGGIFGHAIWVKGVLCLGQTFFVCVWSLYPMTRQTSRTFRESSGALEKGKESETRENTDEAEKVE